jgi:hypothetical protein
MNKELYQLYPDQLQHLGNRSAAIYVLPQDTTALTGEFVDFEPKPQPKVKSFSELMSQRDLELLRENRSITQDSYKMPVHHQKATKLINSIENEGIDNLYEEVLRKRNITSEEIENWLNNIGPGAA